MLPDQVDLHLSSSGDANNWSRKLTLMITAYLSGTERIKKNTFIFDCDPIGANYSRAHLRITLEDLSDLRILYDFLNHHISHGLDARRQVEFPVKEGYFGLTDFDGEVFEREDFDDITIICDRDRLEFGFPGQVSPSINANEDLDTTDGDLSNFTRILEFIEELTGNDGEEPTLDAIHDAELVRRSVSRYRDNEYFDALQTGIEILEARIRSIDDQHSDRYGSDLIHNAFNADSGSIIMSEDVSQQEGIMMMYAGIYKAIRNPLSHKASDELDEYLVEVDSRQAKQLLQSIDYLLWLLEHRKED